MKGRKIPEEAVGVLETIADMKVRIAEMRDRIGAMEEQLQCTHTGEKDFHTSMRPSGTGRSAHPLGLKFVYTMRCLECGREWHYDSKRDWLYKHHEYYKTKVNKSNEKQIEILNEIKEMTGDDAE